MCKEILLSKLKKLSMFLTLSLIICIFTVLGYASSIAYAANEANVTFVEEYAKPGQVLSVELDGVETTDTTVIWKVDGKKVAVGLSYTPKTSDLEKFIEVSVLDSKNNVICENKLPCVNDMYLDGDICFHLRQGEHFLSRYDWNVYMQKFLHI